MRKEDAKRFLQIRELEAQGFNRTEIAEKLGMGRRTLYDLMARCSELSQAVEAVGHDARDWKYGWSKTDKESILIYNPFFSERGATEFLEETLQDISKKSPKVKKRKVLKNKDGHCLVLNLTDAHIGSPGYVGNEAMIQAVQDTLDRSKGYTIDQIIFVGGSDLLHTDTSGYTTTAGTSVETGGQTWSENAVMARNLYVALLEDISKVAPVHYVHVSGNHDEISSYLLSLVIEARFHNNQNITFDTTDEPRKYHKYGQNLMCFTHGDRIKEQQLPIIMASEAREQWGVTKHHYVYCGHLHHSKQIKYQSIKDHAGVTVQFLRAPVATDAWHKKQGLSAPRGIQSFLHSKECGQVAQLNCNL